MYLQIVVLLQPLLNVAADRHVVATLLNVAADRHVVATLLNVAADRHVVATLLNALADHCASPRLPRRCQSMRQCDVQHGQSGFPSR